MQHPMPTKTPEGDRGETRNPHWSRGQRPSSSSTISAACGRRNSASNVGHQRPNGRTCGSASGARAGAANAVTRGRGRRRTAGLTSARRPRLSSVFNIRRRAAVSIDNSTTACINLLLSASRNERRLIISHSDCASFCARASRSWVFGPASFFFGTNTGFMSTPPIV
jgi:hypothetical protein